MVFPFHSAPEKGVIYQKQILLGTRGLRQRHDLTADVAQSKAATAFLQDVTQSKSLQCSFPKRCRAKLATAVQNAARGKMGDGWKGCARPASSWAVLWFQSSSRNFFTANRWMRTGSNSPMPPLSRAVASCCPTVLMPLTSGSNTPRRLSSVASTTP